MCERGLVHSVIIFMKEKYYKWIINKSAASLWTTIFQKKSLFARSITCFHLLQSDELLKARMHCLCGQCQKPTTLEHLFLS